MGRLRLTLGSLRLTLGSLRLTLGWGLLIAAEAVAAQSAAAQPGPRVARPPAALWVPAVAHAQWPEPAENRLELARRPSLLRINLEAGFLGVLSHRIQLSRDGTRIDYRQDAGQDVLFPFWRASLDVTVARRHIFTLLYQPLDFETRDVLERDVRIDGLDFAAGTPLTARYQFPFYRFGWAYDLFGATDRTLALGLGLQIRNANVEFQSGDGSLLRRRSDVGFVPLLRVRGRFPLAGRWWLGFEADGFYAPISGLNLSDRDVLGAILDTSVRVGWAISSHSDLFVNLRYLGGGARGEGEPAAFGDGWQSNWLHFLVFSLGVSLGP